MSKLFRRKNLSLDIAIFISLILIFGIILMYISNYRTSLEVESSSAATLQPCLQSGGLVCGADGKSYFNQCTAKNAQVGIDCNGACPCADVAYFQYSVGVQSTTTAIMKLTGKTNIAHARALIKNKCYEYISAGKIPPSSCSERVTPSMTVVPKLKDTTYNSPWHFITEPSTTTFQNRAPEVCDTTIEGVEAAVLRGAEVSPSNLWCPWQFRLIKEVKVPTVGKL